MPLETSYTSTGAGSGSLGSSGYESEGKYWQLPRLKRAYSDWLSNKREEVDEQIDSRRYYHGSQWTQEQITALKKRKQPIMTFNRIGRKVDAVVGLVEKLRQDPKAYARTPQHTEGADLATAVIRYVLDEQEWKAKSPLCALDGAVDGIGGIELDLVQGDQGDPEIGLEIVDTASFFYDARSYKHDFSDARYLGIGKWMNLEDAKEMFPDALFGSFGSDSELTGFSDRERRWFRVEGVTKQVRIVDIWYKHKGKWCWAIFTGGSILEEGESYLKDEKGKDFCKYLMFSCNVDQDGDRYSFVRNMKSAQDGINAKQSKMQHILASKRLFVSSAGGLDVEKTRAEMARPDGVVVVNGPIQDSLKADDQTFDFTGIAKLLELNLAEIENFGPNPALIGQGIENKSGRAIALLQQAGMAELGPYILSYRGWKIRTYRAIFNAVRQHWTSERYIRVTDDQDAAQFVAINQVQPDPMTGQMIMTNQIGALDVDIILDEGPDSMTMAQDTYDALLGLAQAGAQVPPDILIELSPNIDSRTKQAFKDRMEKAAQQPPPELQIKQAELQMQQQKDQSQLELEQKKGEQQLALQQQLGLLDVETERMKLGIQAEHEDKKMAIQNVHEHQKMQMANDHENQRMDREAAHEERKVGLQVAADREKTGMQRDLKREEMHLSAEQADKEQSRKVDDIKQIIQGFEKSMAKLAEAVNKPKKVTLQKGKDGRIAEATIG